MKAAAVGNALPLSPRPVLRGECPDCKRPTAWEWEDPSHGGVQEYPGRYRCMECHNVRDEALGHRWMGEQIARAVYHGCSCWKCGRGQTLDDVVERDLYMTLGTPMAKFGSVARHLVAFKTDSRIPAPLVDLVVTNGSPAAASLARAAGGVLAIEDAIAFGGELFNVLVLWAEMRPEHRPALILRFNEITRRDRKSLEIIRYGLIDEGTEAALTLVIGIDYLLSRSAS